MMKKIISIIITTILISGCATTTLKAPCDANATDCGPKIKINQWDS